MLAPRGVPPKPQNKEKRPKNQGFLGFKPGFDTAAPRSLDPRWNFPDSTRFGDREIWGHPPGHFSPKSPSLFRPFPSGATCHAIQATDRRPELRSEVVRSCGGASSVPILPFSSFWWVQVSPSIRVLSYSLSVHLHSHTVCQSSCSPG